MLMKKLIALLSVLALTVLASCGKTEVSEENTATGTEMENTIVIEDEATENEATDVVEVTEEVTTATGTEVEEVSSDITVEMN